MYNIYLVLNKEQLIFTFIDIFGNPHTQLTHQQVKDYLNISESTYKRKVKDGTLRPVKLPGGDRFYLKDLLAAYLESRQKGRI
ncbi:ABC-type siderophore export system fused ATPase/permease subunit [Pedobacter sp. AK013]|uniref:helix-turn-helix domain-containing protein n=1 Tax=Pedobacter sp. AK013 TaxID=2723071 RepID=UPI0018196AB2|nr:helix-turn-helix domain-containing protein [Pedobacter sp. AK013]MBB6239499.1 ABC-type siderophore export system fused ATPase/permease subunit [Pedobacter sp. AK013]